MIIWITVSITCDYLLDLEARDKFLHGNPFSLRSIIGKINDGYQAREWLVRNVKGIGYKEVGHFLRNIGFDLKIFAMVGFGVHVTRL